MQIQSTRPLPRQVRVNAYIDGKSEHIEALKLNAVDRLERAQAASSGDMQTVIDGDRHTFQGDALRFTALGLAPAAVAAGLGWAASGSIGALVGGAVGLAVFTAPAGFFLHRALKAPQWPAESRLTVGQPTAESTPVSQPGVERLRNLVDSGTAPDSRQVLFLSGHGDREVLAHMPLDDMSRAMRGSQMDVTILDACLQGQLEVMARLAPWAGLVLASPHKIKARGFDLEAVLQPAHLKAETPREMAIKMASECNSTTPSFAVIDTALLKSELLPALDTLGHELSHQLRQPGGRESITKALKGSLSTDGLVSRRVDLGSFLENLKETDLEALALARETFRRSVPYTKNEHSLSFHLSAGRDDQMLPSGWRTFLRELNVGFKPLF